MDSYQQIIHKLNRFNRKYYTRLLIRGLLVFSAVGLIILVGVLSVEYFLWLGTGGRFFLLFLGLAAEGYLLFRFILIPLFYLLKFRKGISHKKASLLIGHYFPEVGDKLYNLLDLADDNKKSELLLASMEQRSLQLSPIPFTNAIDYAEAWKYARYMAIPAVVVFLIWISGNLSGFFSSYERVVNFDTAYQPPAPFVFETLMGDLEVLENEAFTVQVSTRGSVKPEAVSIHIGNREYLLQEENGIYHYTFKPPLETTGFYFSANGLRSKNFVLKALRVPAIENFAMELDYPSYLNKKPEVIKSTGNAVFPEGTLVRWTIRGKNTMGIDLRLKDTVVAFLPDQNDFSLAKRIYSNTSYHIVTTNENVRDHEVLRYEFSVVKDANPVIRIKGLRDTLNPRVGYYSGEVSDDYRIASVKVVAYPEGEEDEAQTVDLELPQSNYEQFYYTFPSGLKLEVGRNYEYYFIATDNDEIHGGKTSRSQVFRMRLMDEEEVRQHQLESQQGLIKGMSRTLEKFREEEDSFKKLSRLQKETNELNYNDQTKIRDFMKRQRQQEDMMEKFSRELKNNLEDRKSQEPLNELLRERLERQEMEARKNAGLLEELRKLANKLDKEELGRRLEELGKQRQSNQRNLEQLLELTKRYYVTEKASELARKLVKLADTQTELGTRKVMDSTTFKAQSEVNKEFEKQMTELDSLRKENLGLKKPLDIDIKKEEEQSVKDDQGKALEELKERLDSGRTKEGVVPEEDAESIKSKQKDAGRKIGKMSEQLQQSSMGGGGESGITEDAEMLRQILDNLITFSFKQELLFKRMEDDGAELVNYTSEVREQQDLRELFGHIDDSLFALSLRRAELSEFVNEQIAEVYYNTDKALESISENRVYQGVSHQQYVFTAANTLAEFLAQILDNMQQSLGMGSGQGNKGEGFQLPDIIKAQGELKEKMGNSGKEGKAGEQEQGTGKDGKGSEEDKGEGRSRNIDGNGREGQGGDNMSEKQLNEIYEIFKEQQAIRTALEKQLQDILSEGDRRLAEKILKQMESFENELLERGITEQTMGRISHIEHELLKMENAVLKQGERKERESTSNERQWVNPVTTRPGGLENYKEEIDILNRQALPLRQIFQDKVRDYFREDD